MEFLEYIKINDYVIELKKSKQSLFGLIYSLRLIRLRILKIYIKINLVNDFIQLFKSLIGAFIFFN